MEYTEFPNTLSAILHIELIFDVNLMQISSIIDS
jgi:hypothetical protein